MGNQLARMLKLADTMLGEGDEGALERLCTHFEAFAGRIKTAHMEPVNDGTTPNPWRRNMDYASWENSPYFGSVAEFMEKFPGGIRDWVEWRRKTQKERNLMWKPKEAAERTEGIRKRTAQLEALMEADEEIEKAAHFVPVGPDDTKKFPGEPHLYSGDMDRFKDVKSYIKKWHSHMRGGGQDASDGALKAVHDFISYWQEMRKGKGRRKRKQLKGKGK